jgi:polar amino acid transport system permease protein
VSELQLGKVLSYWPDILAGLWLTLQLSLLSIALGLILGLLLALGRNSQQRSMRWPAAVYIEFFRTTPPLVQIVWLYYALPALTGRDLGAFGAAAVALGLNIAAFLAEIFRAGLLGVAQTQWQAAKVLRLSGVDTLRFVILPQAFRNVLPPTGTTLIYLIKSTALASAIGTPELLRVGQLIAVETFRPVEALTIVAVAYFILTYPLALIFAWIERRFSASRG